ncbi:thiamine phosphate synthase [Candidatus Woesearchaeota archaeon]|nr:thiamine phosphate synthase [Candidatus Woesearchaeota archaeon]
MVNEQKSRLYLVTSSELGVSLFHHVEEALKAGVGLLQYREKDRRKKSYLENAQRLKEMCAEYNTLYIVNDNPWAALHVNADGVHIGQEDISLIEATKIVRNKIIGVTCYTLEQALEAQDYGATYIGMHLWNSSKTKPLSECSSPPIGTELFKEVCANVNIPCVAIGGINESNIEQVLNNGADYIAMVSGILCARDVYSAVQRMNQTIGDKVNENKRPWLRI